MIEVRVFGSEPPCISCKKTEDEARKAAIRFPDKVRVTKCSALAAEALELGLLATPAVVVNGRIISQGRVPLQDELERVFRSELGG